MTTMNQERPGVYSSYEASGLIYGGSSGQVVGAVGLAAQGEALLPTTFTSAALAERTYGTGSNGIGLSELVAMALRNGASAVVAVPAAVGQEAPSLEAYTAALGVLAQEEDISLVICDTADPQVHGAMKDHVEECAAARRERIALVAPAAGETVTQLTQRAAALNSERVLLISPCPVDSDGAVMENGALAAACVAGILAGDSDPAVPLGGASLAGLSGLEASYSDGDINLLVTGGVTALESVGSTVLVVRGITTRTTTGGVSDTTWRESTTVRIVDDVISAVRTGLRAKFLRTKNTSETRSAIASQVVITLEDKLEREIIDGYDSVTVTQDTEDPTRCLVSFQFSVAHGLNQIYISAHITV